MANFPLNCVSIGEIRFWKFLSVICLCRLLSEPPNSQNPLAQKKELSPVGAFRPAGEAEIRWPGYSWQSGMV